jgi:hypothetical protein
VGADGKSKVPKNDSRRKFGIYLPAIKLTSQV